MSVRALTWSFNLHLHDMAAKSALNALADHADEDGICWPSIARIALFAGCDEKTARRALQRLVALDIIDREERPGKSDLFRLNMDVDLSQNQPLPEAAPLPEATPPNEAQTPPSVTGDPSQPDPDPSHGGSRTFKNRQGTIRTRASASAGPDGPPRPPLPDTAKWVERLANHKPLEGKPCWKSAWGLSPDSSGRNGLIPPALYREWREKYEREMAASRAGRAA